MKPIQEKHPNVRVSGHAWQRWRDRTGGRKIKSPKALARVVSALLYNNLSTGVQPDRELSIKVDMGGIIAVTKVDPLRGWIVKTFLLPGEEEEVS